MPRYESAPVPGDDTVERKFQKPFTYKPNPSGFTVVDATGIEMFPVNFVADQMRDQFPQGMTYDEALALVRLLVRSMNEHGSPVPTERRTAASPDRSYYRGQPGKNRGYAADGYR